MRGVEPFSCVERLFDVCDGKAVVEVLGRNPKASVGYGFQRDVALGGRTVCSAMPTGFSTLPMTHKWFTLVELLVVIAIIAILAAMLFPALARGKVLAQSVYCKNNMRQVHIGNTQYAMDYEVYGGTRFYNPIGDPGVNAQQTNAYFGAMQIVSLYIGNYVKDRATTMCPAMGRTGSTNDTQTLSGVTYWRYNRYMSQNVLHKYWGWYYNRYQLFTLSGHAAWDSFAGRGKNSIEDTIRNGGNYSIPYFERHAKAAWMSEPTQWAHMIIGGANRPLELAKGIHGKRMNVAFAHGAVEDRVITDLWDICAQTRVASGDHERAEFLWGKCGCHRNHPYYGWLDNP